jgi:hypothetical protein
VGEDDGVAFADEVVDADAAMGGVQLQVGDGVADGEARHGRCDALAPLESSTCELYSMEATGRRAYVRAVDVERWQPGEAHGRRVAGLVATEASSVSALGLIPT